MPNIVKTVGVGRDYDPASYTGAVEAKARQAIQAALNFFSGKNFVTDGDTGEIVIYNGEGGGTNGAWEIELDQFLAAPTSTTTSATFYLKIRGSVALSFGPSDGLRPNKAKGTYLSGGGDTQDFITSIVPFTRIEDLQIVNRRAEFTVGGARSVSSISGNTDVWFKRCIIWDGTTDNFGDGTPPRPGWIFDG